MPRERGGRHDWRERQSASTQHPYLERLLPDLVLPGWPTPSINLLKHWRGSSLLLSTHPGAAGATGADRRNELLFSWALEAETVKTLGYDVALLSSDPIENTSTTSELLGDPFTTISDPELALAKALGLPTDDQMGSERYAALTLVVHEGEISGAIRAESAADARSEVATVLRFLRAVHE